MVTWMIDNTARPGCASAVPGQGGCMHFCEWERGGEGHPVPVGAGPSASEKPNRQPELSIMLSFPQISAVTNKMTVTPTRMLWEPTNPDASQMTKFRQHIAQRYSVQLGELLPAPIPPPTVAPHSTTRLTAARW